MVQQQTTPHKKRVIKHKKHALRNGIIYSCAGIVILAASLAGSACYLLAHVNNYLPWIQKKIYQKTGYHFEVRAVQGGFNSSLQPSLQIVGLNIYGPQSTLPFLQIKKIKLALSYASLWHLMPIFNQVEISGSQLNFEFNQANELLLNGLFITDLDTPAKKNSFDIQPLLWAQQSVMVQGIDITLLDSKHHMLPFAIHNFELSIKNSQNRHDGFLEADLAHGKLQAALNFNGRNLSSFKDIKDGNLQINSVGDQGYLVNLTAKVSAGELQSIHTQFDSNHQQIQQIINSYSDIRDFSGEIQIDKDSNNFYTLYANDLLLNTSYGYLFKHASINGVIGSQGNGGRLDISNLHLEGINSLIKFSQLSDKLQLSGDLNTIHCDWQGSFMQPQHPRLITQFSDMALISNESNLPSFNHLNGQMTVKESSGELNLQMKNATLGYPTFFYQSWNISQFYTTLKWQFESQQLNVNWENTLLQTPELNLVTTGNYNNEQHKLTAKATLNSLNLAELYKLLPTTVNNSGVSYLKQSLQKGYLKNLKLNLDGDPREFPFANGGGNFNLSGQVENVQYQIMPQLTNLTNINGDLTAHNQKIQLKLTSGNLGKVKLDQALISLADINASSYTVMINGQVSGSTNDFMDYLESSPYQEQIIEVKNKIDINGNAIAKADIKIPLSNPARFELSGYFQPDNNQIDLDNQPISIKSINGKVNFNQRGMTNSSLSAEMLSSHLQFNTANLQTITVYSPDLNYTELVNLFNPKLSSILSGTAATTVTYSTKAQLLNITSNLESVTVVAPQPLAKPSQISKKLDLAINLSSDKPEVNLNYADILFARAALSNDGLEKLQIALGSNNYVIQHPISDAPITIKAKLENIYITQWTQFITNLLKSTSTNNESAIESTINTKVSKESQSKLYPIQVEINSNAFWLNNYNLDAGSASFIITPESIAMYVNTPDIMGSANYLMESNNLTINLEKLLYSDANYVESNATPWSNSFNETHNLDNSFELQLVNKASSSMSTESLPQQSESTMAIESNINFPQTESEESHSHSDYLRLPMTHFNVQNFYYQNHYLGQLNGTLYQQDATFILENVILKNDAATTRINMIDHCINCDESATFVAINVHSDVNNFGNLVDKLSLGDMFKNGNGTIDLSAKWRGNVRDFEISRLLASIDVELNNGELTHINPGLFGALMGVINLSAINNIANLNHFNFNNLFGKGFAYKQMTANAGLRENDLKIEAVELQGEVADVHSFGNYYLESNTVDSYLTVKPRLDGTVATTAGIVTLNPFIGMFVYLGEKLIGDPINEALAMSYHVTGDVESPTFTQTKISKQLMNNFKSSLSIIRLPASPKTNGN